MNDQKRPPDFDWVTERHNCSLPSVFALLKMLARRNVEKFSELTHRQALVEEPSGFDSFFSVIRPGNPHFDRRAVAFQLEPTHIEIRGATEKPLHITLTLNNDGHCKLRVNGAEPPLDPWQVLRIALEPLLF